MSFPGGEIQWCNKHKHESAVDLRHSPCLEPGCNILPSFGTQLGRPERCLAHKICGDVNVVDTTCESIGCSTIPSFGQPGERARRCASHKTHGDVNVVNRRCSVCLWVDIHDRPRANYINPDTGRKDMCYNCHLSTNPEKHTRVTVRKEQFILAEIQRQIPDLESYLLTWDCRLPLQNCFNDKPDMAWGVNDTLIHVEIDERGEGHEDNIERIVAIHAASNLSNHKLIRFNPDRSSDGSQSCFIETKLRNGDRAYKRNLIEWNRRIPILVESVRDAFNNAIENVNVSTKKRKLFF